MIKQYVNALLTKKPVYTLVFLLIETEYYYSLVKIALSDEP